MTAPALEADEYIPPEPAPTAYLVPLAELAKSPAPMPDEAAARLAAAAARRKLAQRRKLSASIARERRKASCPAADLPPAPMPFPARQKASHAVQKVKAPGHCRQPPQSYQSWLARASWRLSR
jgi:hypothetical protein